MPGVIMAPMIVIAAGICFRVVGLATRPARRRQYAAMEAARQEAQDAPIAGLTEGAAGEGWHGPLATSGFATEGTVNCVGNLLVAVHGELNPVNSVRSAASLTANEPSQPPSNGCSIPAPRLVHCYGGESHGRRFVVGNVFGTLVLPGPTNISGPRPPGAQLAGAFCTVAVANRFGWLYVVPDSRRGLFGGNKPGPYPALDARHWLVLAGVHGRDTLLNDPLTAYIASRENWGFALSEGVLTCVSFEPLRSFQDARALADATVEAARLVPDGPWAFPGFSTGPTAV